MMAKNRASLRDRISRGEPVGAVTGCVLQSMTPLVRLGMWRRLRAARVRVEARVISFGNLTAGGVGKTPAVIERAQIEIAVGRKVAVLTRGYGARVKRPAVLWGRDATPEQFVEFGDEPLLIAKRVPDALIVKDADRVAGARIAIERFGCDTLILDDGFQYVRLERDENTLVIDATNPFGNGRLIPRGTLREPLSAIARATHVVLTRCDQAAGIESLTMRLAEICPGAPIRTTRHTPTALYNVATGEPAPLSMLREAKWTAACAIGNPGAFERTLRDLGTRISAVTALPDHTAIDQSVLAREGNVVVTEKDAVRIVRPPENVYALAVALEDWPGAQSKRSDDG